MYCCTKYLCRSRSQCLTVRLQVLLYKTPVQSKVAVPHRLPASTVAQSTCAEQDHWSSQCACKYFYTNYLSRVRLQCLADGLQLCKHCTAIQSRYLCRARLQYLTVCLQVASNVVQSTCFRPRSQCLTVCLQVLLYKVPVYNRITVCLQIQLQKVAVVDQDQPHSVLASTVAQSTLCTIGSQWVLPLDFVYNWFLSVVGDSETIQTSKSTFYDMTAFLVLLHKINKP